MKGHFYLIWLNLIVVSLAVLSEAANVASEKLPAFPRAEGFGAYTPGGRGGKVFLVTNLNDSGPGSLRAACEAEGPRIVIFRMAGIIELQSPLVISNPYITIAGQSAPGDGICLKKHHTEIRGDNVIIRYLRFRRGDEMEESQDALWILGARYVIIDHCSVSWGSDEVLSATHGTRDVTVQWCIISEGLNYDGHSMASGLDSEDSGFTFHHNIFAHNRTRNPRIGSTPNHFVNFDFRNNILYDWGDWCGYSGGPDPDEGTININYVGNFLKPGPSTGDGFTKSAFLPGGFRTRMYVTGNYMEGYPEGNQNNWLLVEVKKYGVTQLENPIDVPKVTTDDALKARDRVLTEAGATLPVRDAVDARIIEEIKTGGGHIINSQVEVGGWPEYKQGKTPADTDLDGMPDEWEQKHGLNPNDISDNSKDSDGDGYTNIEEFLNGTKPFALSIVK